MARRERAVVGEGFGDFGGMMACVSVRLSASVSQSMFVYFLMCLGACLCPPCPLAHARLLMPTQARQTMPTKPCPPTNARLFALPIRSMIASQSPPGLACSWLLRPCAAVAATCSLGCSDLRLSSLPGLACSWLLRPCAAVAATCSPGCSDLRLSLRPNMAHVPAHHFYWRYAGRGCRIAPTCLVEGSGGRGELWLSAIDPVLDAGWLQDHQV
jgi:hypothetical protein